MRLTLRQALVGEVVVVHNKLKVVITMKLNEKSFAKASGVWGALFYIGCYLFSIIWPVFFKLVTASWFHMVNFNGIWKVNTDGFILGLISFTVFSWLSGWFLAASYNKFSK